MSNHVLMWALERARPKAGRLIFYLKKSLENTYVPLTFLFIDTCGRVIWM